MIVRKLALFCSVPALVLVTACSSYPPPTNDSYGNAPMMANSGTQYGNVSRIEIVSTGSGGAGGAILGAVIGAAVGNQIGSGSGRAAATGVGAIGGAMIGNSLQKRNEGEVYRVSVRLDNGQTAQFDYQRIDDLRVGDRVKVEDGQLHRV